MDPHTIETATPGILLEVSDSCGGLTLGIEDVEEASIVFAHLNEGQALRAMLALATRYNLIFTERRCDVNFRILGED